MFFEGKQEDFMETQQVLECGWISQCVCAFANKGKTSSMNIDQERDAETVPGNGGTHL